MCDLYNCFDNFDDNGCIINDNDKIFFDGIDIEDKETRSFTFSTKKILAVLYQYEFVLY